ncbi:50S ribosomal protein L28 [Candidatus Woesebacteria bacterium]|nr:MAG: 50S ribosomal protein L28 [Candidatus Woesebacteria bacterium]
MAYICEICEKKTVIGRSQRHKRGVAGKRWRKKAPATRRAFRPNLQKVTLSISGKKAKMRICTKCLKRIKKSGAIGNYKNIAVG